MKHLYTSTYCQHELHDQCRLTCKVCKAPCLCPCHLTHAAVTKPEPKKGIQHFAAPPKQ